MFFKNGRAIVRQADEVYLDRKKYLQAGKVGVVALSMRVESIPVKKEDKKRKRNLGKLLSR